MKNKCSTRSTDPHYSLFTRCSPAIAGRRRLDNSGFVNLRALLALLIGFTGVALAIFAARDVAVRPAPEPERYMPVPGGKGQSEAVGLERLEQYWHDRLTFPTGRFDPAWVRAAASQHARMTSGIPAGIYARRNPAGPLPLTPDNFTALGPQPERMTG